MNNQVAVVEHLLVGPPAVIRTEIICTKRGEISGQSDREDPAWVIRAH